MKVEPARWYAYCDRVGLLVWQDMPSGDAYPKWEPFKYNGGEEVKRSPESEADYRQEWRDIMDALMPYSSIVVWTPFNESWGNSKPSRSPIGPRHMIRLDWWIPPAVATIVPAATSWMFITILTPRCRCTILPGSTCWASSAASC